MLFVFGYVGFANQRRTKLIHSMVVVDPRVCAAKHRHIYRMNCPIVCYIILYPARAAAAIVEGLSVYAICLDFSMFQSLMMAGTFSSFLWFIFDDDPFVLVFC